MNNLRHIPAIDELLQHARIQTLLQIYRRDFVVDILRQSVEQKRSMLLKQIEEQSKQNITEDIIDLVETRIKNAEHGTLQRVINGTGVVLHTNMGRAPLGTRAMNYLNEMATGYNNLELDLQKGERGSRYWHVENLLQQITGAEAGLVVNNNAAAVLLALTTLAKGREVIVSRGQLVEIGGAFRIPDVMKQSAASLIEVGTTNKTYIKDYEEAITEQTALLFSAHTSNYKIVGFSEEVKIDKLVELGQEKKIPVMLDLGSGILADLGNWGLKEEPTVQQSVKSGADIVTFSGDKLLGGPQAGIIVGKKEYIEAMKKHQLTRALRVDKLAIAALEGTLLEYLTGNPQREIPVIHMLTRAEESLCQQAEELTQTIKNDLQHYTQIKRVTTKKLYDMVGGGAYPTYELPGYGVEIEFENISLEQITNRIRLMNPALLTRKQEDKMQISVRTLLEGDEKTIVELIKKAFQAE
ncbi:MAG: L-seryl-tRNA(Sec) selenium transferase [Bacillota bacterium]|nr:L-seryl-tRNA(Sec) selenium transferase [Bacillota bacterium]